MGEHNPQVALVTTLNEVFEPGGMMQVFTELNE